MILRIHPPTLVAVPRAVVGPHRGSVFRQIRSGRGPRLGIGDGGIVDVPHPRVHSPKSDRL